MPPPELRQACLPAHKNMLRYGQQEQMRLAVWLLVINVCVRALCPVPWRLKKFKKRRGPSAGACFPVIYSADARRFSP